METWATTPRRVFLAFGSLLAIFGVASYFAFAAFSEIHDGMHDIKHLETSVRTALELASALRDQHARQAHTLIAGDGVHLASYEKTRQRVFSLIAQARRQASDRQDLELLEEMERASDELDVAFKRRTLPALLKGDRAAVNIEQTRALELILSIQERANRLSHGLDTSVQGFEQHAHALQHETFRWMLGLLGAAMLLAGSVGLYIVRSIVGPIARLREGAARLARGDLSTRIEVTSADELGQLARQFNAMTHALSQHQEELVQSERLAGIGRLAAGIAHEINNPLCVILGYVRVLRKKARHPAAEDLNVIEEEAIRCQEIVEGLLDLSRPMLITDEPVDLRQLTDEVVERVRESLELRDVAIHVRGAAIVPGHGQRLRQVILNLVRNAVEAVVPRGRVEVRIAEPAPGQVAVAVSDTGAGIPPEARDKLFEPFFTTKPSGTGLGLAVSQAIAHAHGGSIEFEPAVAGATFTLHLPAARRAS